MVYVIDEVKTYRVDTEEEVKEFINQCKREANEEGYILQSYSSTLKEKKSKGEVIDSGFSVKISKKFNDFWTPEEDY